jgi:hypothetical protein
MSSPFTNIFDIQPNVLRNRKNKYSLYYTENLFQKEQRKYLKARSSVYKKSRFATPKLGSTIKIFSIKYLVDSYNPYNGKHTLLNIRSFQKRHFDLQLYNWKYDYSVDNKFKKSNLLKPIPNQIQNSVDILPKPLPNINNTSLPEPFSFTNSCKDKLDWNTGFYTNLSDDIENNLPKAFLNNKIEWNYDIEAVCNTSDIFSSSLTSNDLSDINEYINKPDIFDTELILKPISKINYQNERLYLDNIKSTKKCEEQVIENNKTKQEKEKLTKDIATSIVNNIFSNIKYDYFTKNKSVENIKNINLDAVEPKIITIKNEDLIADFKEGDLVNTELGKADIINVRNDNICEVNLPHMDAKGYIPSNKLKSIKEDIEGEELEQMKTEDKPTEENIEENIEENNGYCILM